MNTSETMKSATTLLREVLTKTSEDEQGAGIIAARDKVLARYQAVSAPDHLSQLTDNEFKGFLLFDNNHHWTGLARKGYSLCADMPRLREALTILLDESQTIGERLDRLIPRRLLDLCRSSARRSLLPFCTSRTRTSTVSIMALPRQEWRQSTFSLV